MTDPDLATLIAKIERRDGILNVTQVRAADILPSTRKGKVKR